MHRSRGFKSPRLRPRMPGNSTKLPGIPPKSSKIPPRPVKVESVIPRNQRVAGVFFNPGKLRTNPRSQLLRGEHESHP